MVTVDNFLSKDIATIGIESAKVKLLSEELRIHTYEDLLKHYPFRYEDRSKKYTIRELNVISPTTAAQLIQLEGYIKDIQKVEQGRKKKLTAHFEDGTGKLILIWFHNFSWVNKVKPYLLYRVWGKINHLPGGQKQLIHPEIVIATKELQPIWVPIYHTTERLRKNKLDTKGIALLQKKLLNQIDMVEETLPPYLSIAYKLISLKEAFKNIHFPSSKPLLNQSLRRLKFEELFYIQLKFFKLQQTRVKQQKSKPFKDLSLFNTFYHNQLPFRLTEDQEKVIKDMYRDLSSGNQMNRLLQGDVGSGKTIVAFLIGLMVIGGQAQVAIMAPTEILARQHYKQLALFADTLNVQIALLTGTTRKKERSYTLYRLKVGLLPIIVGTHALLNKDVSFKELGLVIIDEQHRFGVAQRAGLLSKNQIYAPHVLIMTATPIPRTLAMTFYGDLDLSTIYTLPVGRKPIVTRHYYESARLRVFQFLRIQLAKGKQVYIVYPLIEASETLDYNNLLAGYESMTSAFPSVPIGMVHGKMDGEARGLEMKRFEENQTRILVSTTVIEVGIHVANATVMVIESAERFSLAQLHQLRGRVGRGYDQSYCILMTDYQLSKVGKARIETMVRTNNGFEIAELDLKLRGPGDLTGLQQSGMLNLKIANLATDANILEEACKSAKDIMRQDPHFEQEINLSIFKEYSRLRSSFEAWSRIG